MLMALQRRRLDLYRPYTKQAEFHAAGAQYRERCLLAGNQVGKTLSAGMELAMHLTGLYPTWWVGRRFHGATKWWASNVSNETVRDNPQRILMGPGQEWGNGTIPGSLIEKHQMARGFPNLVDTVSVRHAGGGLSHLQFKAYEQGRTAWQGETLTGGVWFDEEPDLEIYSEGITRLAPGAISLFTVTPLLGMSDVVTGFYPHPRNEDRHMTQMTLDDAGHYTVAERTQRAAGYAPHEREARRLGIPLLGSGRIFPISKQEVEEEALESIPPHWPQLIALDFGYDHPFAAVCAAWDRDADVIHITKAYRQQHTTPPVHVAAIKPWGEQIRILAPHDGSHTQKGDGQPLADIYKKVGLKRLVHGDAIKKLNIFYVEPGLTEMHTRMETGRLKVASHLSEWWAEFQTYHRKKGKIVKERDDLMDATRLVVCGISLARTNQMTRQPETVGMDYQPLSAA